MKLYLKLTKVTVLFYIKYIVNDICRGLFTGLSERIILKKYSLRFTVVLPEGVFNKH